MALVIESCSKKELCVASGATEKLLHELRDKLEEWLKLQPHLPHELSKERLEWIILGSKMSLEQAKQKLDMYYTIRNLVPEFFANRDPREPAIAALLNTVQYAVLPKLTPEKYRTCILRPTLNDPSKFDPWILHRYLFMVGDIRMVEDRSAGDIYVYDLALVSVSHIMHMTPALLKKCEITASKAYASRIKGIHFINAPPFVDRLISMVKSVVKPKIAARLHIHTPGEFESFHKFIPKSILPKEYGGDYSTMDELSALWRDKVNQWRDWFLEQNTSSADERLRPGTPVVGDNLFGFSGSFRKLEVD